MTDKDTILVKQFLNRNQKEIPDNGFSERVMHNLPGESPLIISRRWTLLCWCICLLILLIFAATGQLHLKLHIPYQVVNLLHDLHSPELVERFVINNLRHAMISWIIVLAGAITFAYKQFKSA